MNMKNKTTIKIEAQQQKQFSMPLNKLLEVCCLLRYARKEGDTEAVNNTQLGRLKDNGVIFSITN
jgi:hypothetical protein